MLAYPPNKRRAACTFYNFCNTQCIDVFTANDYVIIVDDNIPYCRKEMV